jgi:hypothetical protein
MKNRLIFFIVLISIFNCYAFDSAKYWELSRSGKFDQIINELVSEYDRNSDDSEINLIIGEAYYNLNKISNTRQYLEKASDISSPKLRIKVWGLNYLARCCYASGEKAKANIEKGINLNASSNITKTGQKLLTEHFIFYFHSKTKVTDINDYAEKRETAFETIQDFFKSKIPKNTYIGLSSCFLSKFLI